MSVGMNSRSKTHMLISHFDTYDALNRRVDDLRQCLKNIQMIETFGEIATEHNLSAPVVATMRAVPGFVEAVTNFPESKLFNIIPEHKSSVNQIAGLEALGMAQSDNANDLSERAKAVVSTMESVIGSIDEVAEIFQVQLASDKTRLESIDLPEDALVHIPVFTMSEEGFTKFFGMLEHYLKEVSVFNVDDLYANPGKLREEIDSLTDIVGDLGDALGITISEYGVHEKDKSEEFASSASTFGEKGITKQALTAYVGRAYDLCDVLKGIATRKDDLINALYKACDEMPTSFNSSEDEYGANEHFVLLSCYVTLTTKLVRESVVLISRLLTTVDSIIELDNQKVDAPVAVSQ